AVGEEVLLGAEMNVLVATSPFRHNRTGETAIFDRYAPDGRLLIKWRDEEFVVDASALLTGVALKAGELVLWDRHLSMALERLDRSQGSHLFLEETPRQTFDEIGGLSSQIRRVQRIIGLHLDHPELVDS